VSIDRDEVRRVLDALAASTGAVDAAQGLPMECYVSDSFHEFERHAVFEGSWLGLGRVEQIPEPGDYFTIEVCDEPLLVIRDRDGGVNVLSNVCTHRQHLLLEGHGNVSGVVRCPLHAWGFDASGALRYATGMSRAVDFDPADHCLPRLAVEIWNGFIFAHHDPDAEPLAPTLAKVDDAARPYGLEDLVTTEPVVTGPFPWNWKTMFENGIEPFHTHFLHKGQHDFAPDPTFVEWDDGDGAVLHPTNFKELDQSFNPLWRGLLEPLPGLTEEHRRQVMFVAALPTLYFGLMPDHVFWMLILPVGPGGVMLHNAILHHRDATSLPNFDERMSWIVQGLNLLFVEDSSANASVQRGRRSRYATPGRYASEEATLPQVNRWLARAYRDGAARLGVEHETPVSIEGRPLVNETATIKETAT
jgi:phenylpropionate dioxygenase-like ring-hydroxylating dioxygenase large terminal subunit